MYRDATTNDVSADDGARRVLTPALPARRPRPDRPPRPRGRGPTLPRRGCGRRPPRGRRRASSGRPPTNTRSMFEVSMPHTTAPIGSLIGKMLGRSVRSTMTSACHAGLQGPGHADPGRRRGRPRRSRTGSRRACSSDGGARPCPSACDRRPWRAAARSSPASARTCRPGVRRSSSTPSPGRMSWSISCWIGGGPAPAAISLDGRERHRGARRRDRVEVRVVERDVVHERDVLAEEPACAQRGHGARSRRRRSRVGVDPDAEPHVRAPSRRRPARRRPDRTHPSRARSWSTGRRRPRGA